MRLHEPLNGLKLLQMNLAFHLSLVILFLFTNFYFIEYDANYDYEF